MKRLSEKITDYILRSGAIQKESYALYQYGFQIGLEMISCLFVCSLGKGKWKLCGTEGSVYTCLGRGPGNQLSETQYITGYMELYNLVELLCDIYSFWNRI
jgi:hypothetical protein